MEEHTFFGKHILGELFGVKKDLLNDAKLLESILSKGVEASGATLCGIQTKEFEPCGVTILGLLSESHVSIHTYPEEGSLFFDAFTCGERCQPQAIASEMIKALKPTHQRLQMIRRGDEEHASIPLSGNDVSIAEHLN